MNDPVLIVVQARMTSTRLPGKVLMELGGQPMLVRMLERLQRVRTPHRIVVATTTDPEDDPIERLCFRHGLSVYRGHPTDLLDRHYQTARAYGASTVAKVPSDCPLIDPSIVDRVLTRFARGDCDYASNLHPASYPDGNDVEVMAVEALEAAWREAMLPMEREHTTPFIWERPERFRLANVGWQDDTGAAMPDHSMSHRWTIDYREDYDFIRTVFEELYPVHPAFGLSEILVLVDRRPELREINARYCGVNWYRDHLHQLKTVDSRHTRPL